MNGAERRRIESFRHIGCIVSCVYFNHWEPYDVHHLVDGGKRLGHLLTIPLSPWYHRVVVPGGMVEKEAYDMFGPTLKKHKREFVARFGTERELLRMTNELLGIHLLGEQT